MAPDQRVRELPLEASDLEPVPLELDLLRSGRAQMLALGAEDRDLRLESLDALLRRVGRKAIDEWPQGAHAHSVYRPFVEMVKS